MKPTIHKPYYSLSDYLKETFGGKYYKISLNGGMTCPNRDGTLDTRGCIFCSQGGSGDFAGNPQDSISVQIEKGREVIQRKSNVTGFIGYFQAFTNTYGSISHLRKIFYEAISDSSIKILSIATRPDCLNDEVLQLLSELNEIKPVWIELGLQSSSPASETFIRRGYPLSVFEDAVGKLSSRKIPIIVHTIIGLPSEEKHGILSTIDYLNTLDIQGIKLQLLHVLKYTDLASYYEAQPFWVPTIDEFLPLLGACINRLRPDIVVHRITGDGPKDILIAPKWTGNKRLVLNRIHNYFKEEDICQGKNYNQ